MQIDIITPSFDPTDGGPYFSLLGLVDLCIESGLDFNVITYSSLNSNSPVPKSNLKQLGVITLLNYFVINCQDRIIYFNGFWNIRHLLLAALVSQLGYRVLVQPRGMLMKHGLTHGRLRKFIFLGAVSVLWRKNITLIFSSNLEIYASSIALSKIANKKVVLPNYPRLDEATLCSRFVPRSSDRLAFLIASRPSKLKGIEKAVAGLYCLQRLDWTLNVIGMSRDDLIGLLPPVLQDWVSGEQRIQCHGFLVDINKEDVLKKSDVLIHLSDGENFGVAIAEALNFGLAVLTNKSNPWLEYGFGKAIEIQDSDTIAEISMSLKRLIVKRRRRSKSTQLAFENWRRAVKVETLTFLRKL